VSDPAPDPANIPEAVEAAWRACEDRWDDAAAHDAFFALASQHGCYAWAAGRYRARAGDATADRMLDKIRRAATATMLATASKREPARGAPYRMTVVLMIVLMLAAIGGIVYVANLRHGASPTAESR
jgi:hypothetical protein